MRRGIAAVLEVGPLLWRVVPAGPFRSARAATEAELERRRGSHPLVEVARATYELISPAEPVLLHGDLHHHNLLRSSDRWLAVDPKPLVGDPEYDLAPFLWNPLDARPTPKRTDARLAAFVAAGLDEDRLRAWAIVRGTLWDLPLGPGEEATSRPLAVVRHLLDRS